MGKSLADTASETMIEMEDADMARSARLTATEAAKKLAKPRTKPVPADDDYAEDPTFGEMEDMDAKQEGEHEEQEEFHRGGADPVYLENIPIPTARSKPLKYNWDALKVGGSFFVAGGKKSSFMAMVSKQNRDNEKKYIAREYTLDGVKGMMVWRTK